MLLCPVATSMGVNELYKKSLHVDSSGRTIKIISARAQITHRLVKSKNRRVSIIPYTERGRRDKINMHSKPGTWQVTETYHYVVH